MKQLFLALLPCSLLFSQQPTIHQKTENSFRPTTAHQELCSLLDHPNFNDFNAYQNTLSKEVAVEKLSRFLVKDPQVGEHFEVTDDSFVLYASIEDKQAGREEYRLHFGSKAPPLDNEYVPSSDPDLPLKGLKIALDPGHVGGNVSKVEARYIDMKPRPSLGIPEGVQFNEGTLSVATALTLKKLLEEQGAEVMLTKTKPGEYVYPVDFYTWLEEPNGFEKAVEDKVATIVDPEKREAAKQWWLEDSQMVTRFRLLFNPLDLKERAKKINAFKPHFSLLIHYNAGAGNEKETGQNLGTKDIYSMSFIPGSFMENELQSKSSRYEFLRLLVTDHLGTSFRVSKEVVCQMRDTLGVDLVDLNKHDEKQLSYLPKACLEVGADGVYARNVGMTRLVRSPLCFAEALCQDNYEECLRLNQKDYKIEGIRTSSRVEQTAKAYLRAILKSYAKP